MTLSEQVVSDCYHEAAHAVFWHRAGVEITELYVRGEGKIWTEWPTTPSPEKALDLAAGCLAGPLSSYPLHGQEIRPMAFDDFLATADFAASAAELMEQAGFPVSAEDLRAVRPDEAGDDYEDALGMLEIGQAACGGLETCYEAVLEKVRLGLEQWWEEIRAVAEALMGAGRLSGPEAVRAIASAGRPVDGGLSGAPDPPTGRQGDGS